MVAETVATPIETEVNGVENMLYMNSRSTNDGTMTLDITFALGTDLDTAQVLVQNRVAIAEPKLPEEARRQGITTKKQSPNILLVVSLISPNGSRDNLYLSNYAILQVKDALARIPGVGDVTLFGARDYSMRFWLDPDQLAVRNLSAGDVIRALREQNVQVAAGRLGQPPAPAGLDFQITLNTLGRLVDEQTIWRNHRYHRGRRASGASARRGPASNWAPRTTTSAVFSTASPRSACRFFSDRGRTPSKRPKRSGPKCGA